MSASTGELRSISRKQSQPSGRFCSSFRCHSVACLDRPGLELGDKIIMPQSAFREVVNISRISFGEGPPPSQFCGVLEFSAPQDQVFLPYWMMQNLLLSEGERVELRSILRPPAGSFVRFRPHDDTFLTVAAQQGPKALMESALRQYSVLSEGVTVLVQHEGETFDLDVVELRTRTASTSPSAPIIHEHDYGEVSAIDRPKQFNDEDREDRLVSSISLLGDLDLEVEFCSSRTSASDSGNPIQSGDASKSAHAESGSPCDNHLNNNPAFVGDCSVKDGEKYLCRPWGARQKSERMVDGWQDKLVSGAGSGRVLPLLAPAKATREGIAAGHKRPRQNPGYRGTVPLAPPPATNSARNRCRAFSGVGMVLGGKPMDSVPVSIGTESCLRRSFRVIKGTNVDEELTQGFDPGEEMAADREHTYGGVTVGEGLYSTFSTWARRNATEAAKIFSATDHQSLTVRSAGAARQNVDGVSSFGDTLTVQCKSCCNMVPATNVYLHELRCSRAEPSFSKKSEESRLGSSSKDQTATKDSCIPHVTRHREGGSEPEIQTKVNSGTKNAEQDPGLHKFDSEAVRDENHERVGREQHNGKRKARDAAAEGLLHSPCSPFPCVYCGLSFRDAKTAGDHSQLCGARTERCEICCSLVSRRNNKAHRLPGGGCDSAIASAQEVEDKWSVAHALGVTRRGDGVGVDSSEIPPVGDSHRGWHAVGNVQHAVGRVERMLAEAVRSSKQASAALHAAQARNKDLLSVTGGGLSLRGPQELLRNAAPVQPALQPILNVGVADKPEKASRAELSRQNPVVRQHRVCPRCTLENSCNRETCEACEHRFESSACKPDRQWLCENERGTKDDDAFREARWTPTPVGDATASSTAEVSAEGSLTRETSAPESTADLRTSPGAGLAPPEHCIPEDGESCMFSPGGASAESDKGTLSSSVPSRSHVTPMANSTGVPASIENAVAPRRTPAALRTTSASTLSETEDILVVERTEREYLRNPQNSSSFAIIPGPPHTARCLRRLSPLASHSARPLRWRSHNDEVGRSSPLSRSLRSVTATSAPREVRPPRQRRARSILSAMTLPPRLSLHSPTRISSPSSGERVAPQSSCDAHGARGSNRTLLFGNVSISSDTALQSLAVTPSSRNTTSPQLPNRGPRIGYELQRQPKVRNAAHRPNIGRRPVDKGLRAKGGRARVSDGSRGRRLASRGDGRRSGGVRHITPRNSALLRRLNPCAPSAVSDSFAGGGGGRDAANRTVATAGVSMGIHKTAGVPKSDRPAEAGRSNCAGACYGTADAITVGSNNEGSRLLFPDVLSSEGVAEVLRSSLSAGALTGPVKHDRLSRDLLGINELPASQSIINNSDHSDSHLGTEAGPSVSFQSAPAHDLSLSIIGKTQQSANINNSKRHHKNSDSDIGFNAGIDGSGQSSGNLARTWEEGVGKVAEKEAHGARGVPAKLRRRVGDTRLSTLKPHPCRADRVS